jgi:hypothetical protein
MAVSPNKARLKKLMGITGDVPRKMNVITISATTRQLSGEDSGAFVVMAGASPSTVLLPPPEAGLHFDIYAGTGQVHIIQATSDVINGNYRHNSNTTTLTRVAVSGKGKLTLHSSHRAIGDRLLFWSDGTNWWVDGIVNNALTEATL